MTRRQALLIGVAKYQSAAIDDLPIVGRDLTVLRDSLEASGFAVEVVGGEKDEGPGRTLILQRLRKACREAKGTDILLLYFSGHGIHYGGRDYLIPADADISDPDYLMDYLVPTELGGVIDQCPAQTILLVIDACREGVKLEAKAIGLSQWGRGDRQKATKRSLFLIFACGPGQYSQYVSGEEGFSLFTRAFAEVLRPQHPACQIDTVLKATQVRLDELVAEHQKSLQEIRVAYESTAEDDQRSRIICEGQLRESENSPAPFVQKTPVGVPFQVPPLPSYYVDRPGTRNRLKRALLTEEVSKPGTLVVSAIYGLGGIGKSVLATALALDPDVQAKFPDGVLWATLGQQPEVLAFLSNWIQALQDFDYKPTTVEAASTHLRSLIHNKRLLLVVDDAWTAEAVEPFRIGGSDCRVLVTTREARVPGADRVDLEQMEPDEAIALLEGYLRQTLTASDRPLALKFAAAVGYLPLALELAAAQVQDGLGWTELLLAFEEEVARLEVLDAPDLEETTTEKARKQRSLKASFNLSLQRLNPEFMRRFAGMGVLPEDVSIGAAAMATLWDVSLDETKRTLRELRRRSFLLDGLAQEGEPTYRMHDLMHDTARSLLQESVGLVEAHRQVCDRYRAQAEQWWMVPKDGYIHAHLTWHLEQAGLTNEIHELLRASDEQGRNAWFEVCDRLGQPAVFVQDVARCWRLAETLWGQEAGRSLVLQVRYALIVTTLNSLASNLPPELMMRLVNCRYWTIEQAWAYVEQIKEEHRQAKAVELLSSHLSPFLVKQAISLANRMQDSGRRNWVTQSLKSQQDRNLQAELPSSIRPDSPGENLKIQKALVEIESVNAEYGRALRLTQLALQIPLELMSYALSIARKIETDDTRIWVIGCLSTRLPVNLLIDALNVARQIQDTSVQAYVLIQSTRQFPIFAIQALETIQSIQDELKRADALVSLSKYLPNNLVSQALEAVQQLQSASNRARALSNLAELEPALWSQALEAAQQIEDEYYRARALSNLAPRVPPALRPQVLEAAQQIEDESNRAEALSNLAPRVPPALWPQALEAAQQIEDESNRAEGLSNLAPHVPPALWPQALEAAQQIEDVSNRAKVLSNLAPHVPPALWPQALEAAQQIENEYYRAEVLSNLAPHLLKALASVHTIHSPTDLTSDFIRSLDTVTFQVWISLLHTLSYRTRPKFLEALPNLTFAIHELGDDCTFNGIVEAMQEVCRQWK